MTSLPEWQKGFPIELLKSLAGPFKERHKPLVFGAFGLTKERDIADALASNKLVWTGKPPVAVAIVQVTARPSEQQDFTQRKYTVPAGAVVVKAFAATQLEAGAKVLEAIEARAGNGVALMVECFEEDDIAKQCVEAAGFHYMATKISAGSEIRGVYAKRLSSPLPPLPAEDEVTLAVLEPDFVSADELRAIEAELDAYGASGFAQHYSDYNKRKSWTSFALHGYSDDPSFIIKPAEMSKSWKEEHPAEMELKVHLTSAAPKFPATMNVVQRLGLRLDRVRFMRLRSKDGELSRHADITDREAGTADGFVSRIHIPIRTSEAVTFFGWTARGRKMETTLPRGALCYLDQRKPHAVKNADPALDRVHLVVDCFADEKLRALLVKAGPPFRVAAAA